MFETVIRGGNVVDGTRSRAFRADVGISDDRIVAVGDLSAAETRDTLDAFGKVVAPGFVDVHNHSDGWMIREPLQSAKTLQGFTTEVVLLDGIGYAPVNEQTWREWFFYLRALDGLRLSDYEGWQTMEEFGRRLDRRTTQNSMLHVPYANVRSLVCGFSNRPVDDFQMRSIKAEIRKGMEAGAVGLSTGLDYIVQCFATTQELIEACKVVAEFDGLYVPHIRYKLGMLPALDEALHISRESGAHLHISHLKAGTGDAAETVLDWVERARKEVSLSFDVYPYMPGSTMLNYLLPYEVWENGPLAALGKLQKKDVQERFRDGLRQYKLDLDGIRIAWVQGKENSMHQGRLLSEYVEYTGLSAEEALLNLLIEERLAVLCVYLEGDDRLIDPFLQHDLYMMGSDGIYADGGMIHPRQYGSAARLLGTCVREHGLMSIEDAVYKLSGHAADRFGIKDRGVIREGAVADVVVFQPDMVQDHATYDQPHLAATGISDVFVSGTPVVREGKPVPSDGGSQFPGRFVRFEKRS